MVESLSLSTYPNSWKERREGRAREKERKKEKKGSEEGVEKKRSIPVYTEKSLILRDLDLAIAVQLVCPFWSVPMFSLHSIDWS